MCAPLSQENEPSEEMGRSQFDAAALTRPLVSYRDPTAWRSIFELTVTAVPFLLLWLLMWAALDAGYWIALLLVVPAAGLLVRLFVIQH
ncbi:MAG TPA: hypothetical protein VL329_00475, partial [Nitrospiraceae bacterium]|nr:hypothetical protein [Nitrospiraceae bacterium]